MMLSEFRASQRSDFQSEMGSRSVYNRLLSYLMLDGVKK